MPKKRLRKEIPNVKDTVREGYSDTKDALCNARITSEVKLKFAADDTVKALNIDVDTNKGLVTLRGTVNPEAGIKSGSSLGKIG